MHAATPRGRRAGRRALITVNSALTVPSRAFTGRPSASTIDLGSAKKERYSSHGTSAISSGAGIYLRVGADIRPLNYPAAAPPASVGSELPAACAPPPGPTTV